MYLSEDFLPILMALQIIDAEKRICVIYFMFLILVYL